MSCRQPWGKSRCSMHPGVCEYHWMVKHGRNPVQAQVAVGTHELSVSDTCYEPASIELTSSLVNWRAIHLVLEIEPTETTLTLDARNWKRESVLAQIYADDVLVGDTRSSLQVPLCTEELRVESSDGSWLGAIQLVETGNQLSVALSRGVLQSTVEHPTSSTNDYPMVNVQVGRLDGKHKRRNGAKS